MLIRKTADGAVAISQPHHAWISGELARVWGRQGFELPGPRDAVLCSTQLHDIGWLGWDQAPQLDAKTGYPLQFDQVEATDHTALWTNGVESARLYGLLPALHISRHGVAIYELTFDSATARPEQAEAVQTFVQNQEAFQRRALVSLCRQPETAPYVQAEDLEKVKRFIVAVDTISLHLCWGVADWVTICDVPHKGGMVSIVLMSASAGRVIVDPWPFAVGTIEIVIEGRALRAARDQRDLDALFSSASPFVERVVLIPRSS